jgi:hypothetical protein
VKETDVLAAAASLFNAWTFEKLVPLLTLLSMACLFVWVIFAAQKRADFDASEFLRGDNGKLSWGRLGAFICLMTMTWGYFIETLNGTITLQFKVLYAVTWSGSLILLQALEVWKGGKNGTP